MLCAHATAAAAAELHVCVALCCVCVQMVEKQGWTYVSKPSQLVRDAHEAVSAECW